MSDDIPDKSKRNKVNNDRNAINSQYIVKNQNKKEKEKETKHIYEPQQVKTETTKSNKIQKNNSNWSKTEENQHKVSTQHRFVAICGQTQVSVIIWPFPSYWSMQWKVAW